jgi:succinyl-CoA synthetase beta subunit
VAVLKLHEYQAKKLLAENGFPVMRGGVAETVDEVGRIAAEIGLPVALKAQVHVGGRGKAGGIRIVENREKLIPEAEAIFRLTIKELPVKKILVEKKAEIRSEYYLGILFDRDNRTYTMLLSGDGGVDIEETARKNPEKIQRISADARGVIFDFRIRHALSALGVPRELHNAFIRLALDLFALAIRLDCTLLEINPLGLDAAGELVLVDAKMIADDNSLYRQKALQGFADEDPESPREAEAGRQGLSYVKLEGNVGCMVNGAGLAMATMDIIKRFGGEPANFLDIGGISSVEKVGRAMELLLRDENVRVVLINIFGGITRCDDVARGLIPVLTGGTVDRPVVIRITGTNEDIARKMLDEAGIRSTTDMEEAARKAVEALRKT